MKISTKGRYGLKAMLDLAAYSLGDQITLKSIAERQNISDKYLEQIFSALRKAGLVKSVKGTQGGYILGKRPSDITVGDILRVLEGTLSVIDAADNMDDDAETCIRNNVWEKIDESIENTVDSITLEDLVKDYVKMKDDFGYVYYI
ncbi:MAG TPA: Rrf2 family transcriptional regulator [Clostridiaceae bacterium]|nr:Rrf2 family transcriptional regulator [Clostridiaceae bacterium]